MHSGEMRKVRTAEWASLRLNVWKKKSLVLFIEKVLHSLYGGTVFSCYSMMSNEGFVFNVLIWQNKGGTLLRLLFLLGVWNPYDQAQFHVAMPLSDTQAKDRREGFCSLPCQDSERDFWILGLEFSSDLLNSTGIDKVKANNCRKDHFFQNNAATPRPPPALGLGQKNQSTRR
jgi:hypothetical protein